MNKARVTNVDVMNVIFIFIVLLLHHVNYTQDYLWAVSHRIINPYDSGISQILQKFAVGGFLFLSGLKLAISKQSEPTWEFLYNRFLRIYPLYFLAVLVFSVTVYPHANGEMPNFGNFAIHALALQAWLPNLYQANYLTIWFVSNLFFCYLAFIILRRYLYNKVHFSLATLTIVLGIHLTRLILLQLYDINIFPGHFDTYFVFFALGMLYSQRQSKGENLTKNELVVNLFISSACAALLIMINIYLVPNSYFYPVLERIFVFGFTIPAFHILLKLPLSAFFSQSGKLEKIAYIIKYVSSASLCIFLFHRPVWAVMNTVMPEKSYAQSLFILGLGIPFIFLASYYVQMFYSTKLTLFLRSSK